MTSGRIDAGIKVFRAAFRAEHQRLGRRGAGESQHCGEHGRTNDRSAQTSSRAACGPFSKLRHASASFDRASLRE
jgi:hypothetical protein